MKWKLFFLLSAIMLLTAPSFSQMVSLSDTTITFKNAEGKILTTEEVRELARQTFSMRQDMVDGKKVITILPGSGSETALRNARLEAFRSSLVNRPVASFTLTDINGRTLDSKELKGKVVLFNFWFTACKPCIQEMPFLNELVQQNTEKPVVFIAPAPENETQVKKFLKKFSFDYNIIPSSAGFISQLKIENYPTHLVIDKEGIIRQVLIGYADDIKEKLQAEINKLL